MVTAIVIRDGPQCESCHAELLAASELFLQARQSSRSARSVSTFRDRTIVSTGQYCSHLNGFDIVVMGRLSAGKHGSLAMFVRRFGLNHSFFKNFLVSKPIGSLSVE